MRVTFHFFRLYIMLWTTVILFDSCHTREPEYPATLVEADSAYMQGNRLVGDSLLEAYNHINDNTAVDMYHQLVKIERAFMYGKLDENQYDVVDFLCRYYERNGFIDKFAKAKLFLGFICQMSQNYPDALSNYLVVESIAKKNSDNRLLCLVSRCQGDLYFAQRILDNSIPYYRHYYQLAIDMKDTLRMALSAFGMGRVYTIQNNADSTIYYYKQSVEWGRTIRHKNTVVPISLASLCDIYIQIEEYDSALSIMPRDELNMENWAYWHLGQGHLDSAAYYFQHLLGKHGWHAERDYLRELVNVERKRGNLNKALEYHNLLVTAEDSLAVVSQAETTQRIAAQYNYSSIKQERDRMEQDNRWMRKMIVAVIAVMVLTMLVLVVVWQSYRQKKEAEVERERNLKHEEENRSKQSREQLEKNQQRLAELERQLAEAKKRGEESMTQQIQIDTDELVAENKSIEARQRRLQFHQEQFLTSPIYIRIKENASQPSFMLTEDEWQQLSEHINNAYDNFTARLLALSDLRDTELRMCYLLKIGVRQIDVARLVGRSRSTVSSWSKRLLKRLAGHNSKIEELADFLKDF